MTTTFATTARRAAPVALALGGALLALGGAPAPAAAATLIQSCPYTILAPGTYVLDRDLTCPAGEAPAILIAADGVRLDLGGRALTGAGERLRAGVRARGTEADPITGLRIENGRVTGFSSGIDLENTPGVRIAAVTATGNRSYGFELVDCPGARVTGNTLTGNQDGVTVLDCDGIVVAGNRMADNDEEGLEFSNTTGARVEGNAATGNGDDGILLVFGDVNGGNLIRGNTTTGNGGSGIEVSSEGNRLEGNRATGNGAGEQGGFDLDDENLDEDPPECANTWRGNRFVTDNEGDGPGAGCIR